MTLTAQLRAIKEEIIGYAEEFGLDFFETYFELLDYDEINEVAAYSGRDDFREKVVGASRDLQRDKSQKTQVRYDDYLDISFCEISVPIFLDTERWGTVRIGFPLDTMQAAITTTKKVLLAIGSLALFAGCLAALFLSRRITRPVAALVRSVEALSKGDYDSPIQVKSRDEIGYLAERFAAMQATVKENIDLLTRTNADLLSSNTKLNHEIGERRKAEDALLRRDAVLTAVSFAAEKLLQEHDWKAGMPDILDQLGQASGVRRIYLTRRADPQEDPPEALLFDWDCGESGVPSEATTPPPAGGG